MQTRPLGDSGLVVTRLGLGVAALGRPGYVNLGHANDLGGQYDRDAMREPVLCLLGSGRGDVVTSTED